MNSSGLWQLLRARLAAAGQGSRHLTVQHLVLSDRDIATVQALLNKVGLALNLVLELRRHDGDLVLVDADMADTMPAPLLDAFAEDRPVVTVRALRGATGPLLADPAALERCAEDLQRQLMDLPLVRRRSPHWGASGWALPSELGGTTLSPPSVQPGGPATGYDSAFDSRIDSAQLSAEIIEQGEREFIEAVLRGVDDPAQPLLSASYGADANLRFDFKTRRVSIDAPALQALRVRRELPQPAAGARTQRDAAALDLDTVLWDLGVASARFRLLGAPRDWWHVPVVAMADGRIERYTRHPVHLEMARRLQARPTTPSVLRRQSRAAVTDVRRFLQAGLMLRLLHWAPT